VSRLGPRPGPRLETTSRGRWRRAAKIAGDGMSMEERKARLALRKRNSPSMNKNNETRRWLPIDVEGVRLATPCVVEQGCQIEKREG
jgi:hypothetical protein